jgi:hypothetical protein
LLVPGMPESSFSNDMDLGHRSGVLEPIH